MLPFVVMAAASIVANEKQKQREREQIYLDQLNRNASRFGGNTDMAHVISGENGIDLQGANYGNALGLVGKLGSGLADSAGDVDVTPNDQTFGEGSDIDSLLKGWKQDDPENDDDFALLGVRRR